MLRTGLSPPEEEPSFHSVRAHATCGGTKHPSSPWEVGEKCTPSDGSTTPALFHVEVGSSDEELEEGPHREAWTIGLIFTTADPRYVGKDREEAGSVLLSVEQVREILRGEEKLASQVGTVWLTTSQMGWPICAEEDEVVNNADIEGYGPTKRCIAPMISKFVRDRGDR